MPHKSKKLYEETNSIILMLIIVLLFSFQDCPDLGTRAAKSFSSKNVKSVSLVKSLREDDLPNKLLLRELVHTDL